MRAAAGSLVALAACGRLGFGELPDGATGDAGDAAIPPPPPMFVDGARLQAVRLVADGAEKFATWYDTQLGTTCGFRTAADGRLRCLPDKVSVNAYRDAACSVPLATMFTTQAACGSSLTYATTGDGHAFAVTGTYTGDRYQLNGDTSCTVGNISQLTYYDVGAEVPPTTFLAGTEQSTVRVGSVSYRELVADDGARNVLPSLYDHVHDAVCDLPQADAPDGPCVDTAAVPFANPAFADAACATPILDVEAGSPATRVLTYEPSLCDARQHVVEVGPPHTGAVYTHTSSGCAPTTLAPGRAAFDRGPDVTAEYPHLTSYAPAGPGRIGELRWRTAGGFDVQDFAFLWDRQTGAVCNGMVDAQTLTTVCAPVWTSRTTTIYTDAACTLGAASAISACASAHAAFYYPPFTLTTTCDGFGFLPVVFDQPFTPPAAFEWTGTRCAPIDLTAHPLLTSGNDLNAFQAAAYVPVQLVR